MQSLKIVSPLASSKNIDSDQIMLKASMVQEQILSKKSPGKSGDEVVFGSSPHSNTDIDKKSKIGSGNRTARSKSDVKMIKRKMSISIP